MGCEVPTEPGFCDRNMDLDKWAVAVGEQPSLAGRKP